ncbi:P-loop containing nucleoside triphosphate hydrolase protein [Guyanagaster necrorhizus]|uniref:P-loop containing nucleoside triphosphate hydrolase protein n=1 Tax=Guyanagaster necrorhizus TaxID=856835 RepID=A0A9P7VJQ9_9AGAR|nr:P-loop containing nucleoside triphosphate hydrolase protein [Guyanagaster necrorhizus MCA 3950]KAG7442396.1 P-loop containing nucleoside triphosphate hydrolase protein [Guyanagaster necrorhizus MCA 3950]
MSESSISSSDTAGCEPIAATPQGPIKRDRLGIFEIAYEKERTFIPSRHAVTSVVNSVSENGPFVFRLFKDVYSAAPTTFLLYLIANLWLSVSPTVAIYVVKVGLDIIERWMSSGFSSSDNMVDDFRYAVLYWLAFALVSLMASRYITENERVLDSATKLLLYPQFAKLSLALDLDTATGGNSFPNPGEFHRAYCKAWETLCVIILQLRSLICILLQACVVTIVLHDSLPLDIVITFGSCVLASLLLKPVNKFGGAGYVFWTKNRHYDRLIGLHQMIFNPWVYRDSIIKTVPEGYIYQEYKKEIEGLGVQKYSEADFASTTSVPAPWYWEFPSKIIVDCFPAVCSVVLFWNPLTPSLLCAGVLLQTASVSLRNRVDLMLLCQSRSFVDLLQAAKLCYQDLGISSTMIAGNHEYSDSEKSSGQGMSVSFQNVSLVYPGQKQALDDVSFDISPGQLIVLVGVNGSGKSSLLNLLPRLRDPTTGSILIDGRPIQDYDLASLRSSITILSQDDVLYPLSYGDNFTMALGNSVSVDDGKLPIKMLERAATMGGSSGIIHAQKEGFDSLYTPSDNAFERSLHVSVTGCGHRFPSSAAVRVLGLEHPLRKPTMLSGGETQRLLASRACMKLLNGGVKLLIADEAISAMDPVAERALLKGFLEHGKGMTMIFVTHRFAHLVKHADQILCLNEGRVVERGTHTELLGVEGEYARMYNAQAEAYQ